MFSKDSCKSDRESCVVDISVTRNESDNYRLTSCAGMMCHDVCVENLNVPKKYLNMTQAKQVINLLLPSNFYPVSIEFEKKAANWSLVMVREPAASARGYNRRWKNF